MYCVIKKMYLIMLQDSRCDRLILERLGRQEDKVIMFLPRTI